MVSGWNLSAAMRKKCGAAVGKNGLRIQASGRQVVRLRRVTIKNDSGPKKTTAQWSHGWSHVEYVVVASSRVKEKLSWKSRF